MGRGLKRGIYLRRNLAGAKFYNSHMQSFRFSVLLGIGIGGRIGLADQCEWSGDRSGIKAFPFIHDAYPAALKKFQHSSVVNRSQISPMALMS